jgi:hypothetical protein
MTETYARRMIDAVVGRFFAAFDNRLGVRPEPGPLIDCFANKATIVRYSPEGADLYTVIEFALPRIELLCGGTLLEFHEWEISASTDVYHGIATRTSRYRKSGILDGTDYFAAGTKCFQLVDIGTGWRIAALAWVDDPA